MLIAHLPAGYILTKTFQNRDNNYALLWLGLLGSVTPDFDLLYFYTIDNRQTLHHEYLFHTPVFWLAVMAVAYCVGLIIVKQYKIDNYFFGMKLFFGGIFLHLILDTVAEHGIRWVYPFDETMYYFMSIPRRYDWWLKSFVLHPYFALEVGITFYALWIFFKSKRIRD